MVCKGATWRVLIKDPLEIISDSAGSDRTTEEMELDSNHK